MLSKSDHIALIPVKKMDRALEFYTKTLGGKTAMRGEGEMRDMWASLKVGRSRIWLIVPEEKEKMKLAYNVFIVEDIKATVTGLKKRGVKFGPAEDMGPGSKKDGPISIAPWGAKSAFFKDSEGNLLMLWEEMSSG